MTKTIKITAIVGTTTLAIAGTGVGVAVALNKKELKKEPISVSHQGAIKNKAEKLSWKTIEELQVAINKITTQYLKKENGIYNIIKVDILSGLKNKKDQKGNVKVQDVKEIIEQKLKQQKISEWKIKTNLDKEVKAIKQKFQELKTAEVAKKDARAELDAAKGEISKLQQELTIATNNQKNIQLSFDKFAKALLDEQNKTQALKTDLDKANTALNDAESKLKKDVQSIKDKYDEIVANSQKATPIAKEMEKVDAEIKSNNLKRDENTKNIENTNNSITSKTSEIQNKDTEIKKLNDEKSKIELENKNYDKKTNESPLWKAEQELAKIEVEVSDMAGKIQRADFSLNQAIGLNDALYIKKYKAELAVLRAEEKEINKKEKAKTSEIEKIKENHKNFVKLIAKQNEEIKKAKETKTNLETEKSTLQNQKKTLETQKTQILDKEAKLSKQWNDLIGKQDIIQTKDIDLNAEVQKMGADASKLKAKIIILKKTANTAQQNFDANAQAITKATKEQKTAQTKLDAANDAKVKAQEDFDNNAKDITTKETINKTAKTNLTKAETSLKTAKQNLSSITNLIKNLKGISSNDFETAIKKVNNAKELETATKGISKLINTKQSDFDKVVMEINKQVEATLNQSTYSLSLSVVEMY